MKFKPVYAAGIVVAILIMALNFYLFYDFTTKEIARWFYPMIVVSLIAAMLPIILDSYNESKRQKEMEEKFLEFIRSLVSSIKSGIPIPKAMVVPIRVVQSS